MALRHSILTLDSHEKPFRPCKPCIPFMFEGRWCVGLFSSHRPMLLSRLAFKSYVSVVLPCLVADITLIWPWEGELFASLGVGEWCYAIQF